MSDDNNKLERDNAKSGYECPHCGYQPTWKETDSGTCPQCGPRRRAKEEKTKDEKETKTS